MKNAWPVKAQALGGRQYRNSPEGKPCVDQNFDVYAVEYTFDDGATFIMDGRFISGCHQKFSSCAQGTKGSAILSKSGDCGMPSSLYKGRKPIKADKIWESKVAQDESSPHQNEWDDLVDAIRNDKPYNEAKCGVEASVVCNMGRMAAHTGQEITFQQALNGDQEYAPDIDRWTMDSPAPLQADANGGYPVPQPGIVTRQEF